MVRAFVRKAITATEVAIVANVDTKRFHFRTFHRIRFDFVLEKQALFFQAFHVGKDFRDLFVRDIGNINILTFLFRFQIVGGALVAFVQRAATNVVNVVFVSVIEYVYHDS